MNVTETILTVGVSLFSLFVLLRFFHMVEEGS